MTEKQEKRLIRTPSQLYHYSRSPTVKEKSNIYGPEFIVRSQEPASQISLTGKLKIKDLESSKKVTVVLLSGQKFEICCNPSSIYLSHLLKALLLNEKELDSVGCCLLGLALLRKGQFYFSSANTKLSKIAPKEWKETGLSKSGINLNNFSLYWRFLVYPTTIDDIKHKQTFVNNYYLQIRHDLINGRLFIPSSQLCIMAALALQAEFGSVVPDESDYFLLEHFLPQYFLSKSKKTCSDIYKDLRDRHNALNLSVEEAKLHFITEAISIPHLGAYFYRAFSDSNSKCWLGVNGGGLFFLDEEPSNESLKDLPQYSWSLVKKLSCTSKRLVIHIKTFSGMIKKKFYFSDNCCQFVYYMCKTIKAFHKKNCVSKDCSKAIIELQNYSHRQSQDAPNMESFSMQSNASINGDDHSFKSCCEKENCSRNCDRVIENSKEINPQNHTKSSPPITWFHHDLNYNKPDLIHTTSRKLEALDTFSPDENLEFRKLNTNDSVFKISPNQKKSLKESSSFNGVQFSRNSDSHLHSTFRSRNDLSPEAESSFLQQRQYPTSYENKIYSTLEFLHSPPSPGDLSFRQYQRNNSKSIYDNLSSTTLSPISFNASGISASALNLHNTDPPSRAISPLHRSGASYDSFRSDRRDSTSMSFHTPLNSPSRSTLGVRMGTKVTNALLNKRRPKCESSPSANTLESVVQATVINPPSTYKSLAEESIDESLVSRFMNLPASSSVLERRLVTVTIQKKNGSIGILLAQGSDASFYIKGLTPGGPALLQGSLHAGDRLVGIDGRSVENLSYGQTIDLLRGNNHQVSLLVSQPIFGSQQDDTRISTYNQFSLTKPPTDGPSYVETGDNHVTVISIPSEKESVLEPKKTNKKLSKRPVPLPRTSLAKTKAPLPDNYFRPIAPHSRDLPINLGPLDRLKRTKSSNCSSLETYKLNIVSRNRSSTRKSFNIVSGVGKKSPTCASKSFVGYLGQPIKTCSSLCQIDNKFLSKKPPDFQVNPFHSRPTKRFLSLHSATNTNRESLRNFNEGNNSYGIHNNVSTLSFDCGNRVVRGDGFQLTKCETINNLKNSVSHQFNDYLDHFNREADEVNEALLSFKDRLDCCSSAQNSFIYPSNGLQIIEAPFCCQRNTNEDEIDFTQSSIGNSSDEIFEKNDFKLITEAEFRKKQISLEQKHPKTPEKTDSNCFSPLKLSSDPNLGITSGQPRSSVCECELPSIEQFDAPDSIDYDDIDLNDSYFRNNYLETLLKMNVTNSRNDLLCCASNQPPPKVVGVIEKKTVVDKRIGNKGQSQYRSYANLQSNERCDKNCAFEKCSSLGKFEEVSSACNHMISNSSENMPKDRVTCCNLESISKSQVSGGECSLKSCAISDSKSKSGQCPYQLMYPESDTDSTDSSPEEKLEVFKCFNQESQCLDTFQKINSQHIHLSSDAYLRSCKDSFEYSGGFKNSTSNSQLFKKETMEPKVKNLVLNNDETFTFPCGIKPSLSKSCYRKDIHEKLSLSNSVSKNRPVDKLLCQNSCTHLQLNSMEHDRKSINDQTCATNDSFSDNVCHEAGAFLSPVSSSKMFEVFNASVLRPVDCDHREPYVVLHDRPVREMGIDVQPKIYCGTNHQGNFNSDNKCKNDQSKFNKICKIFKRKPLPVKGKYLLPTGIVQS